MLVDKKIYQPLNCWWTPSCSCISVLR